ncbi:plasmid recombination protein, partial [Staphylococcus saprophyticus]|uniref:plasmid recombination protein n=1 Tax=Staphylococcus saprophyticus TaxID=29385 RepID=UPI00177CC624
QFNSIIHQKIQQNYTPNTKIPTHPLKHLHPIITSHNQFFNFNSQQQIHPFFQHSNQFLQHHYPKHNLLYPTLHIHHKTPHIHYPLLPITHHPPLTPKHLLPNKKPLTQFQHTFNQYFNHKPHNLQPPISKYKTQQQHKSLDKFKKHTNYHQEVQKKPIKK